MGWEIAVEDGAAAAAGSLESRAGVLVVGVPNVGKRTLLSRLLSVDISDTSDLSSGVLCQGWTIDTKYYSADLSIWTANLDEGFSFGTLPIHQQLAALVMVFDMSDESSFLALQDWVANNDVQRFEILLCIGNKADLVPGHYAHAEYRRYLQRHGESTGDSHPEYLEYGIYETEGCSLLGDDEPSTQMRKLCLEWCSERNIEFVEACASNGDFDKCLSVDGDIQGVERLFGALSAHMWPGMVLKSGHRITTPFQVEKEDMTEDESDYEIEYEVLSNGSVEPWEGRFEPFPLDEIPVRIKDEGVANEEAQIESNLDHWHQFDDGNGTDTGCSTSDAAADISKAALPDNLTSATFVEANPITEMTASGDQDEKKEVCTSADSMPTFKAVDHEEHADNVADASDLDEGGPFDTEDLERLMGEISNMRDNLRLMPDFQRRERAAKLAMRMASMFGDSGDEDDF